MQHIPIDISQPHQPIDVLGPKIATIDPTKEPPNAELVSAFGAQAALHRRVLPWRKFGTITVVLTSKPEHFSRHIDALTATFGTVRMALTDDDALQAALVADFSTKFTENAETRLPAIHSTRNWNSVTAGAVMITALIGVFLGLIFAPALTTALFSVWALIVLGMMSVLNVIAVFYSQTQVVTVAPRAPKLPTITMLVPLLNEQNIAEKLMGRLANLDYPKDKLDLCFVLESSDTTTQKALEKAVLPPWARAIVVPKGTIQTKPRAMNYALDFARGSIIGIYDAEDEPAPDQLHVVANTFAQCGINVACLQGTLDYYNSRSNWLTRCFTVEYASWFRVILPGFARMNLVVPLGGTTLFMRRDVLEKLGGWDAHNVTEDADLGIRLARRGFETVFIPTVTQEEANGRAWPWVKQRSRWLKGYAMTYAVHMRRPAALWRDLGAWRFFGFQVLFLGTLTQFVLSPFLWSFWLIPLGLDHPISTVLPQSVMITGAIVCILSATSQLVVKLIGVHCANKTWLAPWALTMVLYYPLATFAIYKALVELAWKPFFWDKTAHGVLIGKPTPPPRPRLHLTSGG